MKRTVFIVAVLLVTGMAAGVVQEDGTSPSNEVDDGEFGITSSSSATTSVGPNGTEWKIRFDTQGSQCMSNQSTGIMEENFVNNSVEFKGVVQTPNPCYGLESEVKEVSSNSYVLNVTSTSSNGTCVECVGVAGYTAAFEDDKPFELEVVHGGETVETLTHPDYETEDPVEQEGFLSSIMNWLGGLLG